MSLLSTVDLFIDQSFKNDQRHFQGVSESAQPSFLDVKSLYETAGCLTEVANSLVHHLEVMGNSV